jgi:hypothetical protein
VRSFNFIRIAALSLFGLGAVLVTGSVANAQSTRDYNQGHSRTVVIQHRGNRNVDRDRDRGSQTNWYTGNGYNNYNNYNRYDQDRDDRNSNSYGSSYGRSIYGNGRYQQRSTGLGTILQLVLGGRRH